MNLLISGIEPNIAYGTCMVLIGLLALAVWYRKKSATQTYHSYALPTGTARKSTSRKQSEAMALRTMMPAKPSRLPARTNIAVTSIEKLEEKSTVKLPQNDSTQMSLPVEIPGAQISDEVKMNSPYVPFESFDQIALPEFSGYAAASNTQMTQSTEANPFIAYGHLELGEPGTQEMETSQNTQMKQGKALATATEPIGTDDSLSVRDDVVMFPLSEPYVAKVEKTDAANLLSFYGLNQQPFDVTPDPAYLYLSASHSEALASLKQGIDHCRGFMMLVAEPGMGKTTLLHKLMEELTDSARVVFLFQTQCTSRELLCYILNELEVDHSGMDAVAMHRALNQALLEEMLRGRRFVLVVDEAQNLQEPVLETIRLLSDFEATHSKLIQIVLAGQPQLAETLMRDSLVQLRQRIAVLSSLKSLSVGETAEYVDYRLRSSGWNGQQIFTADALAQIAESSGGVPRSINNYCFGAMLKAFHRGRKVVDAELVKEVAGTLNLESLVRRPQSNATSQRSIDLVHADIAVQIAKDSTDIPNAEVTQSVNSAPFIGPLPNPEVILTGNLTEKVRSQGWSKRHEYRILVTLERDPFSGLPVADRYYCCSMYMDEAQASALNPGKPVRIKIEQD